jgi:hypothetical protein
MELLQEFKRIMRTRISVLVYEHYLGQAVVDGEGRKSPK